MCEPMTIMAVAGGLMAGQMMAPKGGQMSPTAPEKPPQASKAPDIDKLRRANGAGAAGGMNASSSSTLLTGPGGVAPGALTLGRNTLLGS